MKFSIAIISFFAFAGFAQAGMQCQWGDSLYATKYCPGLLDPSDKTWCCIDTEGNPKCCAFIEFALTYLIIAVVVCAILSLACCVICCLCCPCCFIYKRRHGNMV